MRTAPLFEPRGRLRRRWGGALTAVLLLSGCLFELADLVPPGGAGGNGGISGIGGSPVIGGQGGNAGTPTAGMGGSEDPCPDGQKFCDGQCQPIAPENGCGSESCGACVAPSNAIVGCNLDSGECVVDACEVGYGDCNGDTVGDRGVIQGDGCEYSFGTIAPFGDPIEVLFQSPIVLDDNRNDWQDVPAYRLEQTCRDCSQDDFLAAIVAQNEPPPAADLSAYFRVAWDTDFFYVLVEAFDDHVFKDGATLTNMACQNELPASGAVCDDGFSLFFDGLNDGGAANDDHRIFIGLSGKFFAPAQGQPPPNTVALQVHPETGPQCYRMEARFDWKFIVGTLSGQAVNGFFPPSEAQTYGFDIGVSDWDPSITDSSVMERQSQLFWKNPGDRYEFRERPDDIGTMRLTRGPSGDAGP